MITFLASMTGKAADVLEPSTKPLGIDGARRVSFFADFFSDASAGDLVVGLLDILLVYYVIYRILLTIKGTRAAQMLIGIVLIGVAFFAAERFDMATVSWLLDNFIQYFVIIVIVVFQQDIRRALMRLGQNVSRFGKTHELSHALDEVIAAAEHLAKARLVGLSFSNVKRVWPTSLTRAKLSTRGFPRNCWSRCLFRHATMNFTMARCSCANSESTAQGWSCHFLARSSRATSVLAIARRLESPKKPTRLLSSSAKSAARSVCASKEASLAISKSTRFAQLSKGYSVAVAPHRRWPLRLKLQPAFQQRWRRWPAIPRLREPMRPARVPVARAGMSGAMAATRSSGSAHRRS